MKRFRLEFDYLESKVVLSPLGGIHYSHVLGHHLPPLSLHQHDHRPPPVTHPPVALPSVISPKVAGQTISVTVTCYGWPDNSPPGNSVAYPTPARPVAGGTGTYADPISAAVRQGNPLMPVGTILYVPGLKKYAIVDDVCVSCNSNNWVDLWVGGDANSDPAAVRAREDALTGDETVPRLILIHAPAGLPVDSAPLFAPTN